MLMVYRCEASNLIVKIPHENLTNLYEYCLTHKRPRPWHARTVCYLYVFMQYTVKMSVTVF